MMALCKVKMDKVRDVLGRVGRKALNACVKVKIYGRPERQKYDWEQALSRLRRCYEGVSKPLFEDLHSKNFLLLPDENGDSNGEKIFDIFDIRDALVRCDELPYVEKYPRPGPRYDEMKKLIDEKRAAIEREYQETTESPKQYSGLYARRLVRDCFAGSFPGDDGLAVSDSGNRTYSIRDIWDSICVWKAFSDRSFSLDIRDRRGAFLYNRGAFCRKYEDKGFTFRNCQDCYFRDSNNVIDIEQVFKSLDGKKAIQIYPRIYCPGSGGNDLEELIGNCQFEVFEEFKKQGKSGGVEYSLMEVERRVRDCFGGPGPVETDVLLSKKGEEEEASGVSKANQTYNIFEIKKAVDCFDSKKLGDLLQEGTYETAIKARAEITEEYNEASQKVEIDHGSGIIVHEHFVVTNMHVVEDVMNDGSKEVTIFNAAIGECSCVVFHHDARKDLALLCSKDGLNLKAKKISPLQLCSQPLLPGMQIFAFGFPMSHTGETALFVTGHVSGSKVNFSGQTFAILNCSLNGGNSGGPILCWVKGQLKVAGVAMQKHFKEILTLEERLKIEKIRESLQTSTILGVSDEEIRSATSSSPDPRQTSLNLLTLKLYDALETHSQFNLSNAVPGRDVIDFIKDTLRKYFGQH